jgi:hypothetical protein
VLKLWPSNNRHSMLHETCRMEGPFSIAASDTLANVSDVHESTVRYLRTAISHGAVWCTRYIMCNHTSDVIASRAAASHR